MTEPPVSIIIPNYNRADLIRETLDSVLAQSYTNWECLIVDDGSTDNSKEVIQKYVDRDKRFQLHKRPKDRLKGANACRNYGFELSKGEYINWFDSDDLMMPEKLERQIKKLHKSNNDFTICQTKVVDIEKNIDMGLRAPVLKSKNIFEDYILMNVFWLTGAPMWKKSFLLKNQLEFDEELQQAQDYDFHMRVLDKSTNYQTDSEAQVIFRFHKENMSLDTLNTDEKIFSNVKVRTNIVLNYFNNISGATKNHVFYEVLNIYKLLLTKKKNKLTIYTLKKLLLSIGKLDIRLLKKIEVKTRLILAFISFYLSSKGSKILRINL